MGKTKRPKKPALVRQESWRYKRVKESWRKPKGVTSRMRRRITGHPRLVKVGYGTPKKYHSLHPSGFRELLIHNPEELIGTNPKTEAVRIASTVGEKKKFAIMAKAEELNVKVLNPLRPEVEAEEAPTEQEKSEAVIEESSPEEKK